MDKSIIKQISDAIVSKDNFIKINEQRRAGHTTAALDSVILYGALLIVPKTLFKYTSDSLRKRCQDFGINEKLYLGYLKNLISNPNQLIGKKTTGRIIVFDTYYIQDSKTIREYESIIRNPRLTVILQSKEY